MWGTRIIEPEQKNPNIGKRCRVAPMPAYLDEVLIQQQPRGSYVLEVFHGFLAVGDEFRFVSRRCDGYPFSITVFVNRQCHVRLSACCENKRTVGSRLGQGLFSLVQVKGAEPCIRCLLEKDPIAQKHLAKIRKIRSKKYDEWGNRISRSMRNTEHLLDTPDIDRRAPKKKHRKHRTKDVFEQDSIVREDRSTSPHSPHYVDNYEDSWALERSLEEKREEREKREEERKEEKKWREEIKKRSRTKAKSPQRSTPAKTEDDYVSDFEEEKEEEEVDINLEDNEVQQAATKIQAGFKGMKARKEVKEVKKPKEVEKKDYESDFEEDKDEEDEISIDLEDPEVKDATTKIQAGFRGRMARKEVEEMKKQKEIEDKEDDLEIEEIENYSFEDEYEAISSEVSTPATSTPATSISESSIQSAKYLDKQKVSN